MRISPEEARAAIAEAVGLNPDQAAAIVVYPGNESYTGNSEETWLVGLPGWTQNAFIPLDVNGDTYSVRLRYGYAGQPHLVLHDLGFA